MWLPSLAEARVIYKYRYDIEKALTAIYGTSKSLPYRIRTVNEYYAVAYYFNFQYGIIDYGSKTSNSDSYILPITSLMYIDNNIIRN